jgi:hypothetical protein
MVNLLRFALLCVITLLLIGVAIGLGTSDTGAAEKFALVPIAGLLVYAAALVRRIGAGPQPR